jgi:CxxC-x17-CxxC domain-containing protein
MGFNQGGRNFGGNRGGNRGPRNFSGPREMHDATCADCGNKCQVPFKPAEDRPVYCRDCYQAKRPASY